MTDNMPLAVAYYMNAINFHVSAERLSEVIKLDVQGLPTKLTAIPLFFLASHAAELFLRAALVKRGVENSEIKKFKYQPNLSALLSLVQRKGVLVSAETAALVNGLSEQHADHALRYAVLFKDGKKTSWPPLALVFVALKELFLLTRVGNKNWTGLAN